MEIDVYKPQKHITIFEKDILDMLKAVAIGRENTITIKKIQTNFTRANVFGIVTSRRDFEKAIANLRKAGIPVCSACGSPPGIYLTRTYDEARPWVNQIRNRIISMRENAKLAVEALKGIADRDGVAMDFLDELGVK